MARETGGGVEFWLGLPIYELLKYVAELNDQLMREQRAAEAKE